MKFSTATNLKDYLEKNFGAAHVPTLASEFHIDLEPDDIFAPSNCVTYTANGYRRSWDMTNNKYTTLLPTEGVYWYNLGNVKDKADVLYIVSHDFDVWSLTAAGLPATCFSRTDVTVHVSQNHIQEIKNKAPKRVVVAFENTQEYRKQARFMVDKLQALGIRTALVDWSKIKQKDSQQPVPVNVGITWFWETTGYSPVKMSKLMMRLEELSVALDTSRKLSDLGNAERFIAQYGTRLRYWQNQKDFLYWDGSIWRPNAETRQVNRWIHSSIRDTPKQLGKKDELSEKQIEAFVKRSEGQSRLDAVYKLSQDLTLANGESIIVEEDQLNQQHHLLPVKNGTIDLRTGVLSEHNPDHYFTHLVEARYDMRLMQAVGTDMTPCPTWEKALGQILPDEGVRKYVHRMLGYFLTGLTTEQKIFFLYGAGANGKSIIQEILREVLGGKFVISMEPSSLTRGQTGTRDDLAEMYGARIVNSSESNDGIRVDEALLKKLTGGDIIRARHLYKSAFQFKPTAKILFATNDLPRLVGSQANARRMVVIPFTSHFSSNPADIECGSYKKDPDLMAKLVREKDGILAWLVAGAVDYFANKNCLEVINAPAAIREATDEYNAESDTLSQWIADRCEENRGHVCSSSTLYEDYRKWASTLDLPTMTSAKFGKELGRLGYAKARTAQGNVRQGLRLKDSLMGRIMERSTDF